MIRSRSYSRVSRSWMISRCSSPRNPQRKPKPSAAELSVSNEKLASFSRSRAMLSRNLSKSLASTGNSPQNTTDWTSLNPGNAVVAGFFTVVMVSPTLACATSLICAVMKPISPGPSSVNCSILGRKHPTRSIRCSVPPAMNLTCWPFLMTPSITRTRITTPRYGSYQLSTSIAVSGASRSPLGGGILATIASRISSMPIPALALASTASDASRPMTSSISLRTFSGSAAGRSILLMTGTISWSCSIDW